MNMQSDSAWNSSESQESEVDSNDNNKGNNRRIFQGKTIVLHYKPYYTKETYLDEKLFQGALGPYTMLAERHWIPNS